MELRRYRNKKRIAKIRFRFFLNEIALGFILIITFMIFPTMLLFLIFPEPSFAYSLWFYIARVIVVLIAVPLTLIISTKFFSSSQKGKKIQDSYISPYKGHLLLYKLTKNNYKYQLLYGLLIFLLVLVPLDCLFVVFIPEMIEYHAISSNINTTGFYLTENNYNLFFLSTIIIQGCISITEETISKGLIAKRGSEYYSKRSAVFITSIYLGFTEFIFYLKLFYLIYPFWFPLILFLKSFIAGIILSFFILRKNWIFPLIFSDMINNILFSQMIWYLLHGGEVFLFSLILYIPLLAIAGVVLLCQFSRIKKTVFLGLRELKDYFKNDKDIKENNGDKYIRILIDIIIAALIFFMSILIIV